MRAGLLALCMGVLSAVAAEAAPLLGPGGGTCTTINCQAARFRGVVADEGGFAVPFTMQVQALAGRCLRLETTQQDVNLEMVVVSPDGTTWRDDDGGAGTLSLVKIASTPRTGFYTVHLSHFNGVAVNAAFTLLVGQYPAGNPNCAGGSTSSSSGGGSGLS